jgi:hypothetical protein
MHLMCLIAYCKKIILLLKFFMFFFMKHLSLDEIYYAIHVIFLSVQHSMLSNSILSWWIFFKLDKITPVIGISDLRICIPGSQFYGWWKPKYQERKKNTDLQQITDKLYHIILYRIHITEILLKVVLNTITLTSVIPELWGFIPWILVCCKHVAH